MSGFMPILNEQPVTNVFGEHVYKIRATFAASSAVTFRSKDATIAKSGTAKWLITLPCQYGEITEFHVGKKAAASTIPLDYTITTNSVASAGTVEITARETAASGAATEPAAGDVIYITLGVSQDLQNGQYTG